MPWYDFRYRRIASALEQQQRSCDYILSCPPAITRTTYASEYPHAWVYLEVKDDQGQATFWALEATSAIALARNGVGRDDVRVGEVVKVRCHRLRDGSNGCLLGYLTPLHGDPARGTGIEKLWD